MTTISIIVVYSKYKAPHRELIGSLQEMIVLVVEGRVAPCVLWAGFLLGPALKLLSRAV